MVNIEKQLDKASTKHKSSLTELSALVETRKLLMDSASEDYRILKEMGMQSSIDHAQNIIGSKIDLEKLEKCI